MVGLRVRFLFLCLALVSVDARFPLYGPCVVAPKSFTKSGTYYANARCRRGLVNWQYPTGNAYIHFKRGRNSVFDVCVANMAGGHTLELSDISRGQNEARKLPKFPIRVRSLRKMLRGNKDLFPKTMCIHSVNGEAVLKVKASREQAFMAAFMYTYMRRQ